MLEKARRLLGEQTESGSYPQTVWTDQFLLDGINQANDRLERDGFWWLVKKDTSLTTTSGTNKYTLPTGLQEVEQVWVNGTAAGTQLTPVSNFDFSELVAGSAYTLESDGTTPGTAYIYIYPTPTATGQTITIKGIFRQAQLSSASTSAVTSLPDRYHMYFVWAMVAYARAREEELELAEYAQSKADAIYDDIWRNEIAAGGQEVVRFKHPADYLR